ncbi:MAG: hypothetical protein RBT68_04670 [Spirochaetia bacterium]|jgi:hypothetical protein|nr:hypothetical protein [Spirochaetia bacterium]
MKPVIVLTALLVLLLPIQAQSTYPDQALAIRVVEVLTENYDNQPVNTAMEGIIKQAGKKSYNKLLQDWLDYRSSMDQYSPGIEPAYNGLLRTLKKEVPDHHTVFVNHIGELAMLTMSNFQLIFNAVQEHGSGVPLQDLDAEEIDSSLRQGDYPQKQRYLIAQEEIIKKEIRQIITHPAVAGKLGFYRFFFDQIAKARQKTINKMLESMVAKVN